MNFALPFLGSLALLCTVANAQDECATALSVPGANASFGFSTLPLTASTPPFTCGFGGPDLWLSYVAAGNVFDVSLCGSSYDTLLEVYSGTCGALQTLACNDDSCGVHSEVRVPSIAGATYYVRVGGFNGASGFGGITFTSSSAPNDECSSAQSLPTGMPVSFDTSSATTSFAWPCTNGGDDIWFTATASGATLDISLCGSSFDTCIEVFDGPCFGLTSRGCNDDACGLQSTISVPATAGTLYYVRVGGFNGARGAGTIEVLGAPPGMNDDCAGAIQIFDGVSVAFDTADNTPSASPSVTCYGVVSGVDEWYVYQHAAANDARIQVDLCSSSYDTVVQVFQAQSGCSGLVPLACNDDACGTASRVDFFGFLGGTYYIRVGGFAGATGSGTLTVSAEPFLGSFGCGGAFNSLGTNSALLASGSTGIAANDLEIYAEFLPPNQFGLFVVGTQSVPPFQPANSQGNLCMGGVFGRFNNQIQNSGEFGQFRLIVDNTSIPGSSAFYSAAVGTTSYFQCWHRDNNPGVTSNFSGSIAVTWTP